jgi:hypothetical protein
MKRMFISIVIALALLIGLVPATAAFAAEEGSTTGSFSVGGVAPNTSAMEVYSDAGLTLVSTALTPQVVYYVKVTASDANTLNNIKEVKVKVYYDVGATHPDEATITAGHEQTACIFTWTKVGNTWAKDAGGGTSWAIVAASSVTPTMTASSGDWIFAIKIGKVATESIAPNVWDLHARVTDNEDHTSGYYLWNKSVLWYGEVNILTANVTFGEVALGSGFGANVNKASGAQTNWISNGNYSAVLKSSPTWTGSSNIATLDPNGNCVNAGEFALRTYYMDVFGSSLLLNSTGVTMRNSAQTPETGADYNAGMFWLKIATVFPVDVYSGSIIFTIINS